MRKIIYSIFIICLLYVIVVPPVKAEIKTFPYFQGFENDIFPPSDWAHNGWSRITSTYRSGIASASASVSNTGDDTRFILVDNLNLKGRGIDNIIFWLKISSVDATNTRWMRVLGSVDATAYNNGTWFILRDWENITSWTNWTMVLISANSSENISKFNNAVRGLIKLQFKADSTSTSRTVYLDDFEINVSSLWWNTAWAYRRRIELGQHPENYQIKIVLPFYDNSIRFTETEKYGQIPYWIERVTENSMDVWIRRQENADNVIWVYYGNLNATNISNPAEVFVYADDFEDGMFRYTPTVGSWANVADGAYEGKRRGAKINDEYQADATALYDNLIMENYGIIGWIRSDSSVDPIPGFALRWNDPSNYATVAISPYYKIVSLTVKVNGSATNLSAYNVDLAFGNYYKIEFETFGNVYRTRVYNTSFTQLASLQNTVSGLSQGKFGIYANNGRLISFDMIVIRHYKGVDPDYLISAEERQDILPAIRAISVDNIQLDRDRDYWPAITQTKIMITVENNRPIIDAIARIYSNSGALISIKHATENEFVRYGDIGELYNFFVLYDTTENNLSDADLGYWRVAIEIKDNQGTTITCFKENLFFVDDLTTTFIIDNVPGHKIRVHGIISSVKNMPITVTDLIIKVNGREYVQQPYVEYDNLFAVSENGFVSVYAYTGVVDGKVENVYFVYPNIPPDILVCRSEISMIDRDEDFAGSGATTKTVLVFRIRDNDGDNIVKLSYMLRDNAGSIVNNFDLSSVITYSGGIFEALVEYDPPDNLANTQLGSWDIYCYAQDNYLADVEMWNNDNFYIVDLTTTILINPPSPYVNWPIYVYGNISGLSYIPTIDNIWLIDSGAGSFVLPPSNNWSKEYTVIGTPASVNNIMVRLRDFQPNGIVIDGYNNMTYNINENRLYQIRLKWENDAKIRTIIPSDNITMFIYWLENGSMVGYNKKVNTAIENLIISRDLHWIKITENYYWRGRIPPRYGGIVEFYLPPPKWIEEGTVRQFIFTLSDYTGLYGPPNGQLLIRKAVENQIIIINEDYWDAAWTMPAWLNVNDRYELAVRGLAPLRILGPLDTYPVYERNVLIKAVEPATRVHVYQYIAMSAWFDNNVLRVKYSDNYGGTIFVRVELYRKDKLLMYTESVDDNFLVSWNVPATDYTVTFMVDHNTFGAFTYTIPVMYFTTLPLLPPEYSPSTVIGVPIPLLTIGGMMIVLMIGLAFDMIRSHIAAIAMAITAAGLAMFGILPLNQYTIALILFLAVLVLLRRGKER